MTLTCDNGAMDTELAWAAGFVDGEGCFSVTKVGETRVTPKFRVSQTELQPLERLVGALGDLKINGPYQRRAGSLGKKPYWVIACQGKRWWALVDQLWPYLSEPKRLQIKKVAKAVDGEDFAR